MGAIHSNDKKLPKQWVRFRQNASMFSKNEVARARQRFAEVYSQSGGSFWIGRREYFEVFTDLDIKYVAGGQFLALALDYFALFEIDESGVVDVREILTLLSLLCQKATTYVKLEMVFPLFGPSMTEERVAQLLMCVQRAIDRFGMWESKFSPAQVNALVAKICGEGGFRQCKTVSASMIGDFLLNSVDLIEVTTLLLGEGSRSSAQQYSLIRKKEEVKNHMALMKREAKKLLSDAMKLPSENAEGKKGQRKSRLGSVMTSGTKGKKNTLAAPIDPTVIDALQAMTGGVDSARKDKHEGTSVRQGSGRRGSDSGRRGSDSGRRASDSGRRGSLSGRGPSFELSENTFKSLSGADMSMLRAIFESKSLKRGVNKDRFMEVLSLKFGAIGNPGSASKMFEVFDRDKDGWLDFLAFLVGSARISSGSLEEKLSYLFVSGDINTKTDHIKKQLENVKKQQEALAQAAQSASGRRGSIGRINDGSGSFRAADSGSARDAFGMSFKKGMPHVMSSPEITSARSKSNESPPHTPREPALRLENLVKLVQDSNNQLSDCATFVELIVTMMDYDKNGSVDSDEFERAVVEMPSILASFDELLQPSSDLSTHSRSLAAVDSSFSAENIIEQWVNLQTNRETFKRADWEQFVEFFEPLFNSEKKKTNLKKIMQGFQHERAHGFNPLQEDRLPLPDLSSSHAEVIYLSLLSTYRAAAGVIGPADSSIDFRKTLAGIVLSLESPASLSGQPQLLRPLSQARKGSFYFELFDIDNSGEVDHHEFFEMLYSSQLDTEDYGWRSVEILRMLDENSTPKQNGSNNEGGAISLSEFLDVCNEHEDMRICFARLLHASHLRPGEAGAGSEVGSVAGESVLGEADSDDEGFSTKDIFASEEESVAVAEGIMETVALQTSVLEPILDVSVPNSPTSGGIESPSGVGEAFTFNLGGEHSVSAPTLPLNAKYKASYYFAETRPLASGVSHETPTLTSTASSPAFPKNAVSRQSTLQRKPSKLDPL